MTAMEHIALSVRAGIVAHCILGILADGSGTSLRWIVTTASEELSELEAILSAIEDRERREREAAATKET